MGVQVKKLLKFDHLSSIWSTDLLLLHKKLFNLSVFCHRTRKHVPIIPALAYLFLIHTKRTCFDLPPPPADKLTADANAAKSIYKNVHRNLVRSQSQAFLYCCSFTFSFFAAISAAATSSAGVCGIAHFLCKCFIAIMVNLTPRFLLNCLAAWWRLQSIMKVPAGGGKDDGSPPIFLHLISHQVCRGGGGGCCITSCSSVVIVYKGGWVWSGQITRDTSDYLKRKIVRDVLLVCSIMTTSIDNVLCLDNLVSHPACVCLSVCRLG